MTPSYQRISWGWCATILHNGYFYRGRGGTKREALSALRNQLR